MRDLQVRLGVLTRADGSCQFSQGRTCHLAAVLGPGDIRAGSALGDRIVIQVAWKPKMGPNKVEDRPLEQRVRCLLESALVASLYPRTALHLCLTPLEDFGCLTSNAVNAACLALIDSAAVAMKHLFAAVSIGITQDNEDILVDPDVKEVKKCSTLITFIFESRKATLIGSSIEFGAVSEGKFQESLRVAKEASEQVFQFYRDTVKKKFSKDIIE